MTKWTQRRKWGLCGQCGKNHAVRNKSRCQSCLDTHNQNAYKYHQNKKEQGLCRCGKISVDGKSSCQNCLDRASQYGKNRKEQGLCICGKIPIEGGVRCQDCLDSVNERRHNNKLKELCYQCGKLPPIKNKTLCQDCMNLQSKRSKKYYNTLKSNSLCCKCKIFPCIKNKTCCRDCLNIAKNKQAKRRENFVKMGLCYQCGKLPPIKNQKQCQNCLDTKNKSKRKIRNAHVINGICRECTNVAMKNKTLCQYCSMKHNIETRINIAIKNRGYKKSNYTLKLLGCSINEVRQHLENQFQDGMTWKNYGKNGWHVDHIKPLSLFDLTQEEEQKKAFHYTNLQPLWAKDNLSKGNKYDA